jgi:alpha-tubulin suppressor-like RCC1 family protein
MIRVKKSGFALPTILIASFVMLAVLVVAVQSVVAIAMSLQSQHLNQLAKEASDSGIAMARACLKASDNQVTWVGSELRPWTDCSGNPINNSYTACQTDSASSANCWVSYEDDVRATFTVPQPTIASDGRTKQINSNAVVQQIRSSTGLPWRTTNGSSRAQSGSLNVVRVSTSRSFACSLLDNGQLYCWGYNFQGSMGPSATSDISAPSRVDTAAAFSGKTITSITEGGFSAGHMCAVASNEAYCWGSNTYGQLGDGNGNGLFAMSPEPVKVANGTGEVMNGRVVTEVVTGDSGSCAIAGGRVYCWGDNTYGQLGNGSAVAYSAKPVAVSGIPTSSTVTDISYYQHTVCAVASGTVYCWGWNQWLQVGDGTNTNRSTAVAVGGLLSGRTATVVQTSHATTCAIANNEVYCWGVGGEGALGNAANGDASTPVKVANGAGTALNGKIPTKLSAGFHYNCALTSEGRVYCWGLNGGSGALGRGTFGGTTNVPLEVSGLAAIGQATYISSSRGQSCVVIDASTYCWGELYDGQERLGVQSPTAVSTSGVLSGKTITHIAAGGPSACATASDGVIGCWGSNNNGTLGNNSNTNSSVPVQVSQSSGLTGAASDISIGDNTVCALANGAFWCWGQNAAGKAGDGTQGDKLIPARVSTTGVLSGRTPQQILSPSGGVPCGVATGTTHCWGGYASAPRASLLGNNMIQQANGGYYSTTPVTVTQESGVLSGKTVTALSGNTQICALTSEGRVYCWGTNEMGQLGINTSSAGSSKPVAVYTETGVLAGKTVNAIANGTNFACVSTTEPNIYCWGYNFDGQFGNSSRESSLKPVLVTTSASALKGKAITKLSAGRSHVCALAGTELYCWGYNALGQVGDGSNTTRYTPVRINGGAIGSAAVTDVSLNDYSTCAVANGRAYCWGSNDYGQVGNNASQLSASPTPTRSLRIPPLLQY